MSEDNKPVDDQVKIEGTPAAASEPTAASEPAATTPVPVPAADAPSDSPAPVMQKQTPEEKAAKVKAAAEAREARALAKAVEAAKAESAEAAEGGEIVVKPPSVNQPLLDRVVQILKENVSPDAVAEAYINERDSDLPTIVLKAEHWLASAVTLKNHAELKLDYLRNLSGTDQETHLEVVFHLISLSNKHDYCVKVKTDREQPSIPSVTAVWPTANWNEREVYDLLGVDFTDHPNMTRIMLPDDWVGYPLRKDYVQLDPEV